MLSSESAAHILMRGLIMLIFIKRLELGLYSLMRIKIR